MVAHPVTQVIGEQAFVDILDPSEVTWTCWGCFYTPQWAGAEDGEGIRPVTGAANEWEEKNGLSACVLYSAVPRYPTVQISNRPA